MAAHLAAGPVPGPGGTMGGQNRASWTAGCGAGARGAMTGSEAGCGASSASLATSGAARTSALASTMSAAAWASVAALKIIRLSFLSAASQLAR